MDWVPKELPEHTKLILTMADDCEEFADLEKKIDDKSCFLKASRQRARLGCLLLWRQFI